MNRTKQLLSLLLAIAMIFTLICTASADEGTAIAVQVTAPSSLQDGDQVVLYNPGNGIAMSSETASDASLKGEKVTETDGIIVNPAENLIWTVNKSEDFLQFSQGNTQCIITVSRVGNDFNVGLKAYVNTDGQGLPNNWLVREFEDAEGLYYIFNTTFTTSTGLCFIAADNGNFTGKSVAEPTAKDFGMQLYKLDSGIYFSDVSSSGYKEYIYAAAESGLVTGYSDGTFRPNANITRAQFITMLWRMCGEPETEGASLGFNDAADIAAPYKSAVKWGVEAGIITGYNDNTFRPNQNISRAQMATFMYRLLNIITEGNIPEECMTAVGYADQAAIAAPYADAVNCISNLGVMNGTGNNNFTPGGNANRGMAATVLVRFALVFSESE